MPTNREGEHGAILWSGGIDDSVEAERHAPDWSLEDNSAAAGRVEKGRFEQAEADRIIDTVMDNGPAAPEVVTDAETRAEKDNKMRVHLLGKSIKLRLAGDIAGADSADAMLKTLEDSRK